MTWRLRVIRHQAAMALQSSDPETPHRVDEQHCRDTYAPFWNPVFQDFLLPLPFGWQPLGPRQPLDSLMLRGTYPSTT